MATTLLSATLVLGLGIGATTLAVKGTAVARAAPSARTGERKEERDADTDVVVQDAPFGLPSFLDPAQALNVLRGISKMLKGSETAMRTKISDALRHLYAVRTAVPHMRKNDPKEADNVMERLRAVAHQLKERTREEYEVSRLSNKKDGTHDMELHKHVVRATEAIVRPDATHDTDEAPSPDVDARNVHDAEDVVARNIAKIETLRQHMTNATIHDPSGKKTESEAPNDAHEKAERARTLVRELAARVHRGEASREEQVLLAGLSTIRNRAADIDKEVAIVERAIEGAPKEKGGGTMRREGAPSGSTTDAPSNRARNLEVLKKRKKDLDDARAVLESEYTKVIDRLDAGARDTKDAHGIPRTTSGGSDAEKRVEHLEGIVRRQQAVIDDAQRTVHTMKTEKRDGDETKHTMERDAQMHGRGDTTDMYERERTRRVECEARANRAESDLREARLRIERLEEAARAMSTELEQAKRVVETTSLGQPAFMVLKTERDGLEAEMRAQADRHKQQLIVIANDRAEELRKSQDVHEQEKMKLLEIIRAVSTELQECQAAAREKDESSEETRRRQETAMKRLTDEKTTLENNEESLRQYMQVAEKKIQESTVRIASLEMQCRQYRDKVTTVEADRDRLQAEVRNKDMVIASIESGRNANAMTHRDERSANRLSREETEDALRRVQSENKALTDEVAALKVSQEDVQQAHEKASTAREAMIAEQLSNIQTLDTELAEMKRSNASLEEKVRKLEGHLQDAQGVSTARAATIAEQSRKIQTLQADLEEMRISNASLGAKVTELENLVDDDQEYAAQWKEREITHKEIVDKAERETELARGEVSQLQQEIGDMTTARKELGERLEEVSAARDSLEESVRQAETLTTQTKEENEANTQTIMDEHKAMVDQLGAEKAKLAQEASDLKDELSQKTQESAQTIADKERHVRQLEDEVATVTAELDRLGAEVLKKEANIKSIERERNKNATTHKDERTENSQSREEIENALKLVEFEKDVLEEQVSGLEKTLGYVQQAHEKTSAARENKITEQLSNIQTLQTELAEMAESNTTLGDEIETLQGKLQNARDESVLKEATNAMHLRNIEALKDKLEEMRISNASLGAKVTELENLVDDDQEYAAQWKEREITHKEIVDKAERETELARGEVSQLQQEIGDMTTARKELGERLEEVSAARDSLEESVRQAETLTTQTKEENEANTQTIMDEHKAMVDQLGAEKAKLAQEASDLKDELSQKTQESAQTIADKERHVRQLEVKVATVTAELDRQSVEMSIDKANITRIERERNKNATTHKDERTGNRQSREELENDLKLIQFEKKTLEEQVSGLEKSLGYVQQAHERTSTAREETIVEHLQTIASQKITINGMETSTTSLEAKVRQLENLVEYDKDYNTKWNERERTHNDAVLKAQQEIDVVKNEVSRLQNNIEEMTSAKKELDDRLSKLSAAQSMLTQSMDEKDALAKAMQEKHEADMKEKNNEHRAFVEKIEKEKQVLTRQVSDLNGQLEKQILTANETNKAKDAEHLQETQKYDTEIAEWRKVVDVLKKDLTEVKEERDGLKIEVKTQFSTIASERFDRSENAIAHEAQRSTNQESLTEAENRVKRLRSENETLQNELARLNTLMENNKSQMRERAEVTNGLVNLIDAQTEEIATMNRTTTSLQEKASGLENDVKTLVEKLSGKDVELRLVRDAYEEDCNLRSQETIKEKRIRLEEMERAKSEQEALVAEKDALLETEKREREVDQSTYRRALQEESSATEGAVRLYNAETSLRTTETGALGTTIRNLESQLTEAIAVGETYARELAQKGDEIAQMTEEKNGIVTRHRTELEKAVEEERTRQNASVTTLQSEKNELDQELQRVSQSFETEKEAHRDALASCASEKTLLIEGASHRETELEQTIAQLEATNAQMRSDGTERDTELEKLRVQIADAEREQKAYVQKQQDAEESMVAQIQEALEQQRTDMAAECETLLEERTKQVQTFANEEHTKVVTIGAVEYQKLEAQLLSEKQKCASEQERHSQLEAEWRSKAKESLEKVESEKKALDVRLQEALTAIDNAARESQTTKKEHDAEKEASELKYEKAVAEVKNLTQSLEAEIKSHAEKMNVAEQVEETFSSASQTNVDKSEQEKTELQRAYNALELQLKKTNANLVQATSDLSFWETAAVDKQGELTALKASHISFLEELTEERTHEAKQIRSEKRKAKARLDRETELRTNAENSLQLCNAEYDKQVRLRADMETAYNNLRLKYSECSTNLEEAKKRLEALERVQEEETNEASARVEDEGAEADAFQTTLIETPQNEASEQGTLVVADEEEGRMMTIVEHEDALHDLRTRLMTKHKLELQEQIVQKGNIIQKLQLATAGRKHWKELEKKARKKIQELTVEQKRKDTTHETLVKTHAKEILDKYSLVASHTEERKKTNKVIEDLQSEIQKERQKTHSRMKNMRNVDSYLQREVNVLLTVLEHITEGAYNAISPYAKIYLPMSLGYDLDEKSKRIAQSALDAVDRLVRLHAATLPSRRILLSSSQRPLRGIKSKRNELDGPSKTVKPKLNHHKNEEDTNGV